MHTNALYFQRSTTGHRVEGPQSSYEIPLDTNWEIPRDRYVKCTVSVHCCEVF